jgi:hypothetical protein
MRWLSLLLVLTTALGALPGGTAAAQEPAGIESIEVALWPEYDRPAMLGLYLVRLGADTDLPATVSLPLPEGITEPHVVAAWFPDGSLDDSVSWSVNVQNGQNVLSVTVETTGVWLEFYAPIEQQGNKRSYLFHWPGGVTAGDFSFEVMHPLTASEVTVEPAGQVSEGQDGLNYTRLNLGRLNSEDTPELQLSYFKDKPLLESAIQPPGETTPLALLEVALWPEYDRQDMLVIYRVQLPQGTQLPANVALPISNDAGEPHAVATIGDDRNLYVAPYEMEKVDDWSWVRIESDSLLLQMEYYADLNIVEDQRNFTYLWPGGIEIDSLQYEIQRPPSAANLRLTPAGATQVGQDGLTYIRSTLGSQAVDDRLVFSLAYEKTDQTLTVDALASQPTLERPATTQGGTPDLIELLPWILGGFGALLAGVGLFMLLRVRAAGSKTTTSHRRRRRPSSKQEKLESSPIYCHVCGSQASASDMFCRRCGTKLRN